MKGSKKKFKLSEEEVMQLVDEYAGLCFKKEDGSYVSTVYEKEGEHFVDLHPDLLKQMGWDENTLLEYEMKDNGTVVLRAKTENEEVPEIEVRKASPEGDCY